MKKHTRKMLKVCSCFVILIVLTYSCLAVYSAFAMTEEQILGYGYQIVPTGVGNQNSYSSGSSDYSSSSGYGGSSDYGSSSGRYNSSYTGYGHTYSGSSSSFGLVEGVIVIVFIIIVIVSIYSGVKKGQAQTGQTTYVPPQPKPNPFIKPAVSPEAEIRRTDPNFSEEAFLAWANEVFITLNVAWTKQDWKMIRPFESEELFREHSMQLDEYIRNGTVNYLERVAVKDSFIDRYYVDQNKEYIVVKMRTNMIDYVKETETGRILAGSTTQLWEMVHTLTFMRTAGVQTVEHPETLHVTNCPNCGAPTEITSAGECPYCKSVITSGTFNWVLCKFIGENL